MTQPQTNIARYDNTLNSKS